MIPLLEDIDRELFYRKYESESITSTLAVPFKYSGIRISVAPKLLKLFDGSLDKYEYINLYGGRGGAKSDSIAEKFVLMSRMETAGFLCTREIQDSIDDSVKKNIEDWIKFLGLEHEFIITNKRIINKKTKSYFIFKGIEAGTNKGAIKSLKGVKYVWIEEADTMRDESWKMLKNTIRINGRQFFIVYNPKSINDPVLKIKARRKAYNIEIQYYDNPWLPITLWDEAKECEIMEPKEYASEWMGQIVNADESRILLPRENLIKCIDLHKRFKYEIGVVEGGYDVADGQKATNDTNALTTRSGPAILSIEEWRAKQVHHSVNRIDRQYMELGFEKLYFDATAVGVAAKSEFDRKNEQSKLKYSVIPVLAGSAVKGPDKTYVRHGRNKITNKMKFKNYKSQLWWNLRLRVQNSMRLLNGSKIDRPEYYFSVSSEISVETREKLFNELSQVTFDEDNASRIQIDKAPCEIVIKEDGKKRTVRSPNTGDSTNLSFAGDIRNGLCAQKAIVNKARVIG